METDSLFYRFFQIYPGLLFELLDLPPRLAQNYRFSSVEVKQLAFRIDGIFLPQQDGDPLFFVEVQFQRDERLYARLFAEIFLYLSRHKLSGDWLAVVVYPHAGIEVDAVEHYRELLSSGRVKRIYLDQLPGQGFGAATLRFVVSAEGEAMGQVRSLVEQSQTEFTNPILQAELLDFLETLVVYKFPQLSREEIGKMFGTQDLKQTRFYQDVVQEGIQRGEAELTLRLLRRKVGDIPLSLQTQIRALPVEQMEELGEALLDFGAMSDLTDWLGSLP
ncbi:MAG: Rpn family recombination-promoting nuclease/putative transposase [Synechococcaceae cyanobacterium SM2_3_2]|nr:Rpn family recombination-promoting nuclease/putative transposase [Synechococcaceae cyanobacterium SM2_3_2]